MSKIINTIIGCKKLKSRNGQNCSKKCQNALKKGYIYKSFTKTPSIDIRNHKKSDSCGKKYKKLTKKEKLQKKTLKRKEEKEMKRKKKLRKEFNNKNPIIKTLEDCNLERRGVCKEKCRRIIKSNRKYRRNMHPTTCGFGAGKINRNL